MSTLPIATMASLFNSPNAAIVSSFLLIWIIGMVAMMFPAMIPVISIYARLGPNEGWKVGGRAVPSLIFLTGYLSLYALLGIALFGAVYAIFQLGAMLPWLSQFSLVGVAVVLFLAGVWQLSPLKEKSLTHCISPIGFHLTHSKKGPVGALRMGAEHGTYCVGCCWLYMLVMLAVAAMSLFSMVLLSGLIIVEKVFLGRCVLLLGYAGARLSRVSCDKLLIMKRF
jgi:predicted metal-binding membrane protein